MIIKDLELEFNTKHLDEFESIYNVGDYGSILAITPPIDENYWSIRVRLSDKQSIVAFPKFTTYGIGFQVEKDDWNTNLPYTCDVEKIYNHIERNKGDEKITKEKCIEAIKMIQSFLTEQRN